MVVVKRVARPTCRPSVQDFCTYGAESFLSLPHPEEQPSGHPSDALVAPHGQPSFIPRWLHPSSLKQSHPRVFAYSDAVCAPRHTLGRRNVTSARASSRSARSRSISAAASSMRTRANALHGIARSRVTMSSVTSCLSAWPSGQHRTFWQSCSSSQRFPWPEPSSPSLPRGR